MSGGNEKSIQLDALEREATVNHNLLDQVMGRAKETIGQDRLQRPNGQLISAAAPPTAPGFPPRFLIVFLGAVGGGLIRSEEHTSELQSLMRSSYAVFCLKKKKPKHKR